MNWSRIVVVLLAASIVGCGSDDDSGSDGSAGSSLKSAATIEREITAELDKPPYSELLYTPIQIDCPASISENIDNQQPTTCGAEDSRGNETSFKVQGVGQDEYEFSPGEITDGLSF